MQTHIVPIGNSLGLRLPKAVLESLHLVRASALHIQLRADSIVLKPIKAPRQDWAAAFAAAPTQEPDNLWGDMPQAEAWDE
jgi:antitoxin MazE